MLWRMKSSAVCAGVMLLLQLCLSLCSSWAIEVAHSTSRSDKALEEDLELTRRVLRLRRLSLGLQLLRQGQLSAPTSFQWSLLPSLPQDSQLAAGREMDGFRQRKRRHPPFPRYGRDLSHLDSSLLFYDLFPAVMDSYGVSWINPYSSVQAHAGRFKRAAAHEVSTSATPEAMPLTQRPVPEPADNAGPVPDGKNEVVNLINGTSNETESSGEASVEQYSDGHDKSQLSAQAFPIEDGVLKEIALFPTKVITPGKHLLFASSLQESEKAVPAPRTSHQSICAVSLSVPSGRESLGDFVIHGSLLRSGKVIFTPRIGHQNQPFSRKASPASLIGRNDMFLFPQSKKAIPAPRIGRQDMRHLLYFSQHRKAIPAPRIDRQDLLPIPPSEKPVPAPRVGHQDMLSIYPSKKVVPAPRIGRQERMSFRQSKKAIPAPRIGRQSLAASPRFKRAIPAPRIGRQEINLFPRLMSAKPAPEVERQAQHGVWRSTKAVPAPRIGRLVPGDLLSRVGSDDNKLVLRVVKAVPAPRIGRQEDSILSGNMKSATDSLDSSALLRQTKAAPFPRVGRQIHDEIRRQLEAGPEFLYKPRKTKAAPFPRIGREAVSKIFSEIKAAIFPTTGRQTGSEFSRQTKAAPFPRIGRQDSSEFFRQTKAAPYPRIGRQEANSLSRQIKAAPFPRIGRQDINELFRQLKAFPVSVSEIGPQMSIKSAEDRPTSNMYVQL